MAHTFPELLSWLRNLDEITLMEILEINTEDLIYAFMDKIEMKQDQLKEDIE